MRIKIVLIFILIGFLSISNEIFIDEQFDELKNWESLIFPKIERKSEYSIIKIEDKNILKAKSDNSASGLILKKEFNVYKYPNVSWKWKVENVYKEGNAKKKDGDDYPIRVYVIFKYNPKEASFGEKVKYNLAKKIYGKYPPHSSLNYIWGNKVKKGTVISSAYTKLSKMIVLESGNENINKWKENKINIIDDYKSAFGHNPPKVASIAIMADSDNTKEKSISYVEYIKIME